MRESKKKEKIVEPLQPAYGKSCGKSYRKTVNEGEKGIKEASEEWETHFNTTIVVFGYNSCRTF